MSNERLKVILGHLKAPPRSIEATPTAFYGGPKLEYTLDNPRLSLEQRQFYEDNGFLVIRDLVPHPYLDRWRDRFLDIVEGRVHNPNIVKMKDISLKDRGNVTGERLINKIQDFVWDDILSEHCQLPQVLDYVECFTGPNIMAMHTMLINKPPDSGMRTSRHPMHQDLHYFPFRPQNRIVCAWTAMEKVDVNNGCLFVVPGSHKGKLEQHDYPEWEDGVNKMYHGVRGFDHYPKTLVEMEKGDTVFFHPILLHGSGVNRTQMLRGFSNVDWQDMFELREGTTRNNGYKLELKRYHRDLCGKFFTYSICGPWNALPAEGFRKAISCHYAASDCHYIDVRGTTQENIAKEVQEIARRRGVDGLDFKDIWQFRSRCVRGRQINL